jgi:hypothetical protein
LKLEGAGVLLNIGAFKRNKFVGVLGAEGSGVWMIFGAAKVHTGVLELEGAGIYQIPCEFFVSSIGIEREWKYVFKGAGRME